VESWWRAMHRQAGSFLTNFPPRAAWLSYEVVGEPPAGTGRTCLVMVLLTGNRDGSLGGGRTTRQPRRTGFPGGQPVRRELTQSRLNRCYRPGTRFSSGPGRHRVGLAADRKPFAPHWGGRGGGGASWYGFFFAACPLSVLVSRYSGLCVVGGDVPRLRLVGHIGRIGRGQLGKSARMRPRDGQLITVWRLRHEFSRGPGDWPAA